MTEITRGTVPSWSAQKTTDKALADERHEAPQAKSEPTPAPKSAAKPAPKKHAAKAKAKPVHHKPKHEALVVLHGGPCDGRLTAVASHDELELFEDGAVYARQDQQEGDYRVYRFTTYDGEALPTSQSAGPDGENLLHRDLAQQNEIYEPGSGFHAPRKAHPHKAADKK